jgi:hypothetical protein
VTGRQALEALGCMLIGAGMVLFGYWLGYTSKPTPPEPAVVVTTSTSQPVVIPTCYELDTYGYTGQASCVNSEGRIVRPGD